MKRLIHNIDEDLIIKAAYGEANFFEKLKVKTWVEKDSTVKSLYEQHKKIASASHNLPVPELPDSIQKKIDTLAGNSGNRIIEWITAKLGILLFMKPKLAFSSILAAVLITVFTINYSNEYRAEKQAALDARQDATEALVLVSQVLKNSTKELRTKKINSRILEPIKRGFAIAGEFYKLEENTK